MKTITLHVVEQMVGILQVTVPSAMEINDANILSMIENNANDVDYDYMVPNDPDYSWYDLEIEDDDEDEDEAQSEQPEGD